MNLSPASIPEDIQEIIKSIIAYKEKNKEKDKQEDDRPCLELPLYDDWTEHPEQDKEYKIEIQF